MGVFYFAIGVVSSAIFLALAVRRLEFASVSRAFERAELVPWLPLAVLSTSSATVVRGVRCKLLVSREAKLSLRTATNVVVLGYAVNNVLPARLGEFARAGMLAQTSGLPFVQSLTVTLLERVLDGLCLLLLLVIAGRMGPHVGFVHACSSSAGWCSASPLSACSWRWPRRARCSTSRVGYRTGLARACTGWRSPW